MSIYDQKVNDYQRGEVIEYQGRSYSVLGYEDGWFKLTDLEKSLDFYDSDDGIEYVEFADLSIDLEKTEKDDADQSLFENIRENEQ